MSSPTCRRPALIVCDRTTFGVQFDADRLARLSALVNLGEPIWTDELDSPAIRTKLKDVEVLITSWGMPTLTAERLAVAGKLQAVFHCAGSIRGFVTPQVWDRGITVTTAADTNAIPVAEYTLAAIIFANKRVPLIAAEPRRFSAGWSHIDHLGDLSNFGRTIGVVGFSRIGRRVVDLLRVLDNSDVLVADPYADPAQVTALGARVALLDEVVSSSDVLSLHAPELPSTYHMIGQRELRAMPDQATLINTARGSLVDTDALVAECATGRINAILDVTEPEPLPEHSPLFDLPNVMMTPHVAGSLGSETRRLVDSALNDLDRFLSGAPPLRPVGADQLSLSA